MRRLQPILIDNDHLKVLVVLLEQRGYGALGLRAGVAHDRHDQHASNGRARFALMVGEVEAKRRLTTTSDAAPAGRRPLRSSLIVRGDRRGVVADIEGRQRVLDPEQIVVRRRPRRAGRHPAAGSAWLA